MNNNIYAIYLVFDSPEKHHLSATYSINDDK